MRDQRGRSPRPKKLGELLGSFTEEVAPQTTLASVQTIWATLVGDRIAAVTEVIDERDGVVTVQCSSAVWAQELEMMSPRITSRLREELGDSAPEKLRFRAGT